MAVRAQYPPKVLLLGRSENEMNNEEVNMDFPPNPMLDQSPVFFSNGGNVNPWRRRGRDTEAMAAPSQQQEQQQQSVFSLQSPSMLGLAQFQPWMPSLVSTGLRLALEEQKHSQIKKEQSDSFLSAFYSEDLAAQINQEKNEIEQFLIAQGEQLRQALVERQQRQYRAIIESAGRKLREKDSEIERAARCNAELEERLARFQTESMAWQAKAMAEQAAAASLHAHLQKAAVAAAAAALGEEKSSGESPEEDQESAYVDPCRSETTERPCRTCRRRPATVVLLPCRHLCLCPECDSPASAAGEACPACGCFRTGSLQISFS
ncbi:hypothetical protein KSP39_PZI008576 [Platanthera zijinensis]|uniref:RING-type domain-containing protein n=1 Tax=Platanthera zijinensis TaxID=2320716 RepID=A0AAP0BMZ6_9ASPA